MPSKKILIADDDRDLVHALRVRCERLGLQVIAAYDSMNALTLAHSEHPDVVCLDVSMPGGDGLSVGEMLASDEELSSVPMIMLTGLTDETTIRRCHKLCAYYVLKSADVWDRMEPVIREVLHLDPPPSTAPETAGSIGWDFGELAAPPRGLRRLIDIISQKTGEAETAENALRSAQS